MRGTQYSELAGIKKIRLLIKDDSMIISSSDEGKEIIFGIKKILESEATITFSDKKFNFVYIKNLEYKIILKDVDFQLFKVFYTKLSFFFSDVKELKRIGAEEVIILEKEKELNKYKLDDAIESYINKKDLAQKFINIQPLFFDRSRNFWIWNFKNSFWNIVDEVDILNLISKSSRADTITSKEKTEIIESLKQVGRLCHPEEMKKSWVQFQNKIYDYETGETFKATPKHFSTNPIPWKLGENTDTPQIDKLFAEWVGEDHAILLKEIAAFSLIPDYPIHRIFCLLGEGRNGKSRYLAFIDKLVGRDNTCSVDLDNLIASRFESFSLYKKLVCIMGETNFATVKRTAVLKSLSGQDLFSFESKGKDSIKDINYAKLLISTNNLPETTDKTDGWYRRWLCIDFPNQFPEGKDILKTIPDSEYENFCKQSIDLIKKLHETGKFTNEGTVEERRQRYEERSNPFNKFFTDNCIEEPEAHIFKHEFRQKFKDFCKDNRFREPTDTFIGTKMREKEIETKKIQADWENDVGNKPYIRAWVGVSWKKNTLEKGFVEQLTKEEKVIKYKKIGFI